MASQTIERLIAGLQDDLPRSPALQEKVPALAEAFDAGRMKQMLGDVLLEHTRSTYSITDCVPGKALYLPDRIVNMQYKLTIQAGANGPSVPALVNARLFPGPVACRQYVDEVLAPLSRRVIGRQEVEPFAHPVAMIPHLNMALSVFPIDGLNPTLVEATDPAVITRVLAECLPEAGSGRFLIKDVRLLLAHYGRYKRCVLRFSVDGLQAATQAPQSLTVYGKVDADGLGGTTVSIISAMRESLQQASVPYRFRIPRSLGYFPELKLLVMEALPGKPFFKELLKTWRGGGRPEGGEASRESPVTLEQAVRTCALIAATLHGSDINLGPHNTLAMQVARLREETKALSQVFPELGAQIASWIDLTAEWAQAYPAMQPCFSHGDFTYTQLIFDGAQGGLVDFDSICQAEPAQDLGHYLAYQRLNIIKDQDPDSPFPPEAIESLCSLFMDTYVDASRAWIPNEAELKGRAAIYELISLIRLALHSWEKMKGSRLKQTLRLLEERIECQKPISSSIRSKMP